MSYRMQTLVHRIKGIEDVKPGIVEVCQSLFGRNMMTQATEVIVIEKLGLWSKLAIDVSAQITLDNKPYFESPDGKPLPMPGICIPLNDDQFTDENLGIVIGSGVRFEFQVYLNEVLEKDNEVLFAVQYMLYDGSDSVIANQLIESCRTICPENLAAFRRELITSNPKVFQ